jgi:broad specificity phosphatase PhoE
MPGSRLLLIRHGETEWSRTGRHTGRTDIPLTDVGRQEALATARTLVGWQIDHVYSSPLLRARETAELVAPRGHVVLDDTLVEWDYGSYEGETTPQIRTRVPDWSIWTHEIVGGETVTEVGERADRFIARFDCDVDDARTDEASPNDGSRHEAGTGVVFAHGHLLAVMIARWCGLSAVEGRRFALATATVSLLGWHREDRVIRAINHRCGDVLDPPSRV